MKDAQLLRQFKGEVAVFFSYLCLLYVTSTVFSRCFSLSLSSFPSVRTWCYLCAVGLAVWSHLKCVCTNPGFVPIAQFTTPLSALSFSATCATCHCVKPPQTHHCKTCNRCVYRMDHHCPWVNNCIGYYSQKPFLLFLIYGEGLGCFSLYELLHCESRDVMIWLALAVTGVSILFMTWVLVEQAIAVYYNLSGIDRLQQQFTRRVISTQRPLLQNLTETFGESFSLRWFFPVSLKTGPIIEDN